MAYNMHYLDQDVKVTLDRVRDHTFNDEYMIARFDGKYILNSLQKQILTHRDVDSLEVRESWDLQETLLDNQY